MYIIPSLNKPDIARYSSMAGSTEYLMGQEPLACGRTCEAIVSSLLMWAAVTGAPPLSGCFTPGTFTSQTQAAFREPRLLVATDPRADHQRFTEALE